MVIKEVLEHFDHRLGFGVVGKKHRGSALERPLDPVVCIVLFPVDFPRRACVAKSPQFQGAEGSRHSIRGAGRTWMNQMGTGSRLTETAAPYAIEFLVDE